jgi:hypothetical protein
MRRGRGSRKHVVSDAKWQSQVTCSARREEQILKNKKTAANKCVDSRIRYVPFWIVVQCQGAS